MSIATANLPSVQKFSTRFVPFHALRPIILLLTLIVMSANNSLAQGGTGLFGTPTVYSSGGFYASSIAVADLNGDGKPDLVVTNVGCCGNSATGSIGVLLGNGDGTFQTAVTYSSGGYGALSVVVADVNGDGKPDVVVANDCITVNDCSNGLVAVLLGNGNGTFQTPVTFSSGGFDAGSVAVADVNGDGRLDLIVSNQCDFSCTKGSIGVLLGNGKGSFQTVTTYSSGGRVAGQVTVKDVNGDGKPDLLVANPLDGTTGVLLGNGDGTFQPVVTYNSGGSSVVAADVNGDGKPDLVVVNACPNCTTVGSISVLLGNGDGTFGAPVTYSSGSYYPDNVVVADINGDGRLDVVVANAGSFGDAPNGSIGVLLGNGDGTFQQPVTYPTNGQGPVFVAVADINLDGEPDLLGANYWYYGGSFGTISVLLNTIPAGTPIYAPPGQIIAGFPPQLILDSAPAVTQSYEIDYAPNNMLFAVIWNSSNSATNLYNAYKQYLVATGWTITNTVATSNFFGVGAQNNSAVVTITIVPEGMGSQVSIGYVPKLPPTLNGLSAVVGGGSVYLRWQAPLSAPSGYNIYVNGVKANTIGLLQGTSVPVTGLQNGQLYEFGVTAVGSGGESGPATIFAEPNGFVAPAHPLHPILFLHGINADATAWETTADFLSGTLGWTCGGTLAYLPLDDPRTVAPHDAHAASNPPLPSPTRCQQPFSSTGDYFTVDFGDKLANYTNDPDSTGISRQGDEVGGFIREINTTRPLSIVAWSMAGLAARSYMQMTDPIDAPNQISDLITLGTPHWGVNRAYFLLPPENPFQLVVKAWLLPVLTSQGLIDMNGGCVANGDSTDYSQLSPFLRGLNYNPTHGLPTKTRYVVVSGLSYLRLDECNAFMPTFLLSDWVVPSTSSTLAGVLPSTQKWQNLDKPDVHTYPISLLGGTALPDDFPAILCALDQNCLELQVMSPVDIQVTAPNGLTISPSLTSMPGADYTNVTDASGHDTATVLIPFPQGGQYTIAVTPKPGAQPTDTFTILQTQNGVTTTIANNMQIASIPPAGFQTAVKNGSSFQVNFGGSVQQPLTKDNSGRFVALVTITNQGNVTVDSAQVSIAGTTLGTTTPLTVPGPMTSLAPGASATVTLIFPKTAASSSATTAPLKTSGTYSAGTLSGNWTLTFRSVTLAH